MGHPPCNTWRELVRTLTMPPTAVAGTQSLTWTFSGHWSIASGLVMHRVECGVWGVIINNFGTHWDSNHPQTTMTQTQTLHTQAQTMYSLDIQVRPVLSFSIKEVKAERHFSNWCGLAAGNVWRRTDTKNTFSSSGRDEGRGRPASESWVRWTATANSTGLRRPSLSISDSVLQGGGEEHNEGDNEMVVIGDYQIWCSWCDGKLDSRKNSLALEPVVNISAQLSYTNITISDKLLAIMILYNS